MSARVNVTFWPSNETKTVPRGIRLLKTIRAAGYPIGFSCRGQGVCVACVVWVSGEVPEPCPKEIALLQRLEPDHREGFVRRIACFVHVEDDIALTTDYW